MFCFFALLLLFTLWRSWLDASPTLRVAAPSLPNPNAHDRWLEAAGRLTPNDQQQIAAAVPDGLYPSATGGQPSDFTLAEKEALLRKHRAVITGAREGLRYSYQAPLIAGRDPDYEHLRRFRELSRLLRLEAEVHAARRDWPAALSTSLDALEMGVVMSRGNALLGLLSGAENQAAARAAAWKWAPRLQAETARGAARRMERLCSAQIPYWQTLEEDKRAGQTWLLANLQNRNWRRTLQEFAIRSVTSWPRTGGEWRLVFQIQSRGKAQILNDYTTSMNQLIVQAKRLRWGSGAFLPPTDPLIERLIPPLDSGWFAGLKADTQNRLLLLCLALQAYRAEHGRYPERLEELAPRYVSRVPEDPFAPGQPCRYQRRGAGYLLYSVGPDSQDDGGLPATSRMRARKPGGVPYVLTRDSRGDVVAGKNLW